MNFFDHKDLGNHLLQLCPKVVKHPAYKEGKLTTCLRTTSNDTCGNEVLVGVNGHTQTPASVPQGTETPVQADKRVWVDPTASLNTVANRRLRLGRE